MEHTPQKKSFLFIYFTTFLNFLGFSIIIPVIPFLVQRYEHDPSLIALYVGFILSSYALCQFLAAPALGVLSDRFGRRPILLISLLGSVIGYLLLGFGGSLTVLFIGRVIDGLTGGNISTVFAYVSDITPPEKRGKYFGFLGAFSGLGFMLGPAIGGLAATVSLSAPMYLAAAVTAVNLLWGYFVLPESLKKEHALDRVELSHLNPFGQFAHIFTIPVLRVLFPVVFLYFFAMTMVHGNISVFLKDILAWGPKNIGFMLFVVGFVDIISQGFITPKLLPIFGDIPLTIAGAFLNGAGIAMLGLLAYMPSVGLLFTAIVILNIGDGMFNPSISSMISKSVEPQKQGRVQGSNQSIQAIARVLGPLAAAGLYQYHRGLPYVTAGMIVLVGMVIVVKYFRVLQVAEKKIPAHPTI